MAENLNTWLIALFTAAGGIITIIIKVIQDTQSNKLKILEDTIKALQTQVSNYEGQLEMMIKLVHEKDSLVEIERNESASLREQNLELTKKVKVLEEKVNHLESLIKT